MTNSYRFLFCMSALMAMHPAARAAEVTPQVLFDGTSLDAFERMGDANWRIQEGAVEADLGNGFLVTKESFSDFRLELEFYPERNTNSGVFFRCAEAPEITDRNCYEANIFDTRPDPTYRTGGVTNISPPGVYLETEGKWNTYIIQSFGSNMQVILNGTETARFSHPQLSNGRIALQFAKGGIKFKNVRVTKLSKENEIIGVWKLLDFALDDGRGNVRPWCEGAYGVLIYTEGYVSVGINCESNPSKMIHYSGPYSLEEDIVIHRVQNFSDPSLRQDLRREVEIPGADLLNLVGPFGEGGKAVVSWQRR